MDLADAECRSRFAVARVARLATAGAAGQPHLVPVTFALDGDQVAIAVDHKPKRSTALRRLANIAANPQVSLLVDQYSDDWDALWWVRADGHARIVDGGAEGSPGAARRAAVRGLVAKYQQYQAHPPSGPVILVRIDTWRGWAFTTPGR
ncbi:TIGR03668 family PPOX class F420-dependent oxidoreductase [Parafrankia elaeagni]|uniref:TIGR03668 family PPOX class F420-dependent oxidoreductase n=1 Tax=Parafrankia elaeagni TaxID=222534 RepID=UPI00037A71BC|nr:TIGR03668 family PPOX class F420-dependent oxidoreductase [Parafrankia elaeagni]